TAMMALATPLPIPRRNVLTVASEPALQYCLKKIGKKPAMTVVANEEFAQSYRAQLTMLRRVRILIGRAQAAMAWCSRVSWKRMSGQRSSVSARLTRVGARYTSAPE